MRRTALLFAALALSSLVASSAVASDHYVDGTNGSDNNGGTSWEDAWKTISHALEVTAGTGNAASPTIIQIAPGVYSPSTNGERFSLRVGSYVSLKGTGMRATILDGGECDSPLFTGTYVHVESLNLEALAIRQFTKTLNNGTGGTFAFDECWFSHNSGRPLFFFEGFVDAAFSDCQFTDNDGVFWCNLVGDCEISFQNCLLADNSGLGLIAALTSAVNIDSCTLVNNSGGIGGIDSGIKIKNSTVWGTPLDEDAAVIYSCAEGGWDGEGNISGDPLFVTGPLGDYYLSHSDAEGQQSPCVDAGRGYASVYGLDDYTTCTDHRPDAGIVDIGYHYPILVASSCSSPRYVNAGEIPVEYQAGAMHGLDHVELWYQYEGRDWADSGLRGYSKTGKLTFAPPEGDGEYGFAVVAEDVEDNRSELPDEARARTVYDTGPPTSSASSEPYSTRSTVQVSYSASDTTSGVAWVSLWYRAKWRGWTDTGLRSGASVGSFAFRAEREGEYKFATLARDRASNTELFPVEADCVVLVDTVAPASFCVSPEAARSFPITVLYRATDETSGVSSIELWYRRGGGPWTFSGLMKTELKSPTGSFGFWPEDELNGTYEFATVARDRVSNIEALPVEPDDVTIFDTAPPQSSCSCQPTATGFPISVDYSASDELSGVASVELWYSFDGADWVFSGLSNQAAEGEFNFFPYAQAEGTYYFAAVAEDGAGNNEALPEVADCLCLVRFLEPRIEVSPDGVDFGEVLVGKSASERVVIHNAGEAELEVRRVSMQGDGFSVSLGTPLPRDLAPGAELAFDVSFTPHEARQYSGTLTVESNDPDRPTVGLPLIGSGREPRGLVLSLRTDAESYQSGDMITIFAGALNEGDELVCDLYFALAYDYQGTEESFWFAVGEGWQQNLAPWLPEIVIPGGLDIEVPAFELPIPSQAPDIAASGEYTLLLAGFEPGTFDYVSPLAQTTFELISR